MKKIHSLFLIISLAISACSVTSNGQDDGRIELVLVQVNDIYEIAPLSGNIGGMADDTIYRVVLSDFLISGLEANPEFLNKENPGITKIYDVPSSGPLSDIRLALIRYFENHPG